MSPLEFLKAVWPSTGLYCLASPFVVKGRDGGKDGISYHQKVFDTIEAAAAHTDKIAPYKDVFFAVHTLKEREVWNPEKVNRKTGEVGAYEVRTQANSCEARSLFFDLDVGTSTKLVTKYAAQADAVAGLAAFLTATGLPKPMVVSSGGGLHVHWLLSDPLPAAEWREQAAKLRALARHYALYCDPMRTTDSASVLRVAGTFNLKDPENPRAVVAKVKGVVTPTNVFVQMLDDCVIKAGANVRLHPLYAPQRGHALLGSNLTDSYDGPKVSLKAVMVACPLMRFAALNKEDLNQTQWYNVLQVTRFVEDGARLSEKISADHRKDRVADKIAILESKGIAPVQCTTLADKMEADSFCEGCKFAGKVKNPLMAARFCDEAPTPVLVEEVDGEKVETKIAECPSPYSRLKGGGIAVEAELAGGDTITKMIYEHDLYPVRRLTNAAAKTEQNMWETFIPREGYKQFTLDADALYDRRKFTYNISNTGVFPQSKDLQELQDYMTAYIRALQKLTDAEAQCSHLGWTDDLTKFIMPDKIIGPTGSAPASLSLNAQRVAAHIGRKGTLERQIELMGFYNDKRYLAHQCVVLAGLATTIFHLTDQHGMILNMTGLSGSSKSTALYTAASHWGHPSNYPLNGTNNGATVRARDEQIVTLANYPICFDEITHIPVRDAQDLAMSISQSQHRTRLDRNGVQRASNGGYKATMLISTSNSSLHALLSMDNAAGTAGSMRVVELHVSPPEVHSKSEADDYLHDLKDNYGHIGPAFIRLVVDNHAAIAARMRVVMKELDALGKIAPSERMWCAAIAAIVLAAELSKAAGLLPYSPVEVRDWLMITQVPEMRGVVSEEYSTPIGVLADFLEANHGSILFTNKSAGSRLADGVTVTKAPHNALIAHYDTSARTMLVLSKPFKDYCMKVGANATQILNGLAIPTPLPGSIPTPVLWNRQTRRVLGAGTEYGKIQSWCFEINMNHPEVTGALQVVTNATPATSPKKGDLKAV